MINSVKAAYAVQVGNLHLAAKLPCQDSIFFFRGERACCLALADGAGSVPGSELASSAVCKALAKAAVSCFAEWSVMADDDLKQEILNLAADSVDAAVPGRKPDCTLLLVAIADDGRALWCHIGDGGIFFVSDGECRLLSEPENGLESYITFFLSGADAARHLRVGRTVLSRDSAFLLCSDGVEPTLYDAEAGLCAPAVRIVAEWLRAEPESAVSEALDSHLNSLFRQRSDDDMSLGVICYYPSDSFQAESTECPLDE